MKAKNLLMFVGAIMVAIAFAAGSNDDEPNPVKKDVVKEQIEILEVTREGGNINLNGLENMDNASVTIEGLDVYSEEATLENPGSDWMQVSIKEGNIIITTSPIENEGVTCRLGKATIGNGVDKKDIYVIQGEMTETTAVSASMVKRGMDSWAKGKLLRELYVNIYGQVYCPPSDSYSKEEGILIIPIYSDEQNYTSTLKEGVYPVEYYDENSNNNSHTFVQGRRDNGYCVIDGKVLGSLGFSFTGDFFGSGVYGGRIIVKKASPSEAYLYIFCTHKPIVKHSDYIKSDYLNSVYKIGINPELVD